MQRNRNVIEIDIDPDFFWANERCRSREERWLKQLCERHRRRLKEERKMLSEQEEQALRQDLKNRQPMKPVNEIIDRQATVGQFLKGLLARVVAPVVVSGPPLPSPVDGHAPLRSRGDDEQLLAKTAHVRKKDERLMEFYARTGLGAAQIREMSRKQIEEFVEVAALQEQPPVPAMLVEGPRPLPRKLFIEV